VLGACQLSPSSISEVVSSNDTEYMPTVFSSCLDTKNWRIQYNAKLHFSINGLLSSLSDGLIHHLLLLVGLGCSTASRSNRPVSTRSPCHHSYRISRREFVPFSSTVVNLDVYIQLGHGPDPTRVAKANPFPYFTQARCSGQVPSRTGRCQVREPLGFQHLQASSSGANS
jgi:hypothetical protein